MIATKVGFTRQGPGGWAPVGRPEYLRQQVELNLRHLGLDRIDLLQLHRIDAKVPLEDQIGELAALQGEGKIRHIGLSEVPVEQIEAAREIAPIVSVQNRYNLADRAAERRARALRAGEHRASSRGSRWPPANWPGRAARWRSSPRRRARRRASWRWPGCCTAPR